MAPARYSINSEVSSADLKEPFSDERSGDSENAAPAAVTKHHGVDAGGAGRIAQQELEKASNSLLWRRQFFVVGAVLLSVILVIFLLKFVGIHRDWWPL